MAGAPKQHGPRWRVRWVHPDTKERGSHVLDSRQEGEQFQGWLNGLDNRVRHDDARIADGSWDAGRRGRGAMADTVLFGTFAERHLALCQARDLVPLAPQTIRDKGYKLKAAAGDWWSMPLSAIDRDLIEKAIAAMKKRGCAPSSIHVSFQVVKEVMRAAHESGVIAANPFKADPLSGKQEIDTRRVSGFHDQPRRRKNHELRIPQAEWLKLLSAAKELPNRLGNYRGRDVDQLYLQLRMLVECGLRVGEMLAIKVGQCYFSPEDNFIVLQHTRLGDGTDGPTKTRKDREMMVPDSLAAELAPLCKNRPVNGALFPSPLRQDRGWRYGNWIACRWTRLMRLAREEFDFPAYLDIHPHALRMNHITWARNAGVPLRDIQLQTGQSSEKVVAMYDLGGPESRRALRDVVNTWAPGATQ